MNKNLAVELVRGSHVCSHCGEEAQVITKRKYVAKELGLDNVVIENMPVVKCSKCDIEEPIFFALDKILATVARLLAQKQASLTGKEFRFLRKHLQLAPLKFAELVGTTRETLSRWENGHQSISDSADRFLRTLVLMEEHERDQVLQSLSTIKNDHSSVSASIQIDAEQFCEVA